MGDRCYIAWNGASADLTAALASVSTGTSLKTMMQIKPGNDINIVEWGYSFDTVPTAMVKVELVDTGTINATVTAYAAGDIPKYANAGGSATQATLSTSGSGFTSSAEGSITSTRLLAFNEEWGQSFKQQFPLGREPNVLSGNILRIRATTSTAINMLCYIIWEE